MNPDSENNAPGEAKSDRKRAYSQFRQMAQSTQLTLTPIIVEKERQKAEKARRFAEKLAKQGVSATAAVFKGEKTAKETTLLLPKYVDPTPQGSKKGMSSPVNSLFLRTTHVYEA